MHLKELCLILTNTCNKKCSYCIKNINLINKKEYKQFDINYLSKLDKLKDLTKFSEISILGGEPGLVSKNKLDILFDYLKYRNIKDEDILILTNGYFLKRYNNIYNKFKYDYHIVSYKDYIDYSYLNLKLDQLYIIYNYNSLLELELLAKKSNNLNIYIIFDKNINKLIFTDDFFNKFSNILKNNKNILVKLDSEYKYLNKLKDDIIKNKKYLQLFHKLSYNCAERTLVNIELF